MTKPEINQEVFVLYHGNLYNGKVTEVWDTPKAHGDGIYFIFDVLIENQVYVPPSDFCLGGVRKRFFIRSSNFHYEPHPLNNINWTNHNMFRPAFVFKNMESYEKHLSDTRKLKREYHLQQAELYK